jgi:hypothetical protein
MPFLRIESNAQLRTGDAKQYAVRAARLLFEKTGKPVCNIAATVNAGLDMCFDGNAETKGVVAYLDAIGFADKEDLIRILTEFLYDGFEDVDLSAINIVLTNLSAGNVAKAGKLFG